MNKREAKKVACRIAGHLIDSYLEQSYPPNTLRHADPRHEERINDALLELSDELERRGEETK